MSGEWTSGMLIVAVVLLICVEVVGGRNGMTEIDLPCEFDGRRIPCEGTQFWMWEEEFNKCILTDCFSIFKKNQYRKGTWDTTHLPPPPPLPHKQSAPTVSRPNSGTTYILDPVWS